MQSSYTYHNSMQRAPLQEQRCYNARPPHDGFYQPRSTPGPLHVKEQSHSSELSSVSAGTAANNVAGFGARKFAEQQRLLSEYLSREQELAYAQAQAEEHERVLDLQRRQQERAEEMQAQSRHEAWLLAQQRARAFSSVSLPTSTTSDSHSRYTQSSARSREDTRRAQSPVLPLTLRSGSMDQCDSACATPRRATARSSIGSRRPSGGAGGVRTTMLATEAYELPMAKCADCGVQISFEQLADHQCARPTVMRSHSSSLDSNSSNSGSKPTSRHPSPLTLTIPLPTSLSASRFASDSPVVGSPRSPFLERYDSYSKNSRGNAGSESPGYFSKELESEIHYRMAAPPPTPVSPAFSASTSCQISAAASPVAGTFADAAEAARQREATKRQIQEQREAKKKAAAAAVATNVVMASMRFKQGAERAREKNLLPSRSDDAALNAGNSSMLANSGSAASITSLHGDDQQYQEYLKPSPAKSVPPSRSEPLLQRQESSSASSISSFQSSLLSSSASKTRQRAGSRSVKTETSCLTASTSFERFSEDELPPPAPSFSAAALAAKVASARGEKRTDRLTAQDQAAAPQKRCTRKKSDVDLSNIEALMSDLTQKRPMPTRRATEADLRPTASASAPLLSSPLREKASPATAGSNKNGASKRRCCCICNCSLSTSKKPYVERDGAYFCARDYAERYLPKCRKCKQPVESNAVKSSDGALRGIFHRACFTCFECDARFDDGTFYVLDERPLCARHYHAKNGTLCDGCGEGIEGTCKQTENGERYHAHCLRCQFEGLCKKDRSEFCQEVSPSSNLRWFSLRPGRKLTDSNPILHQAAGRLFRHRGQAPLRLARTADAGLPQPTGHDAAQGAQATHDPAQRRVRVCSHAPGICFPRHKTIRTSVIHLAL